jgi:hypothetical protein
MNLDISSLQMKANKYKEVLNNTLIYRSQWPELKSEIIAQIKELMELLTIPCEIRNVNKIENLESIVVDLGKTSSGISEQIENSGVKRTMIKSNGSLIYQQLFNGKIIVMLVGPTIEGYGDPKPPKTIEILRPDELSMPFIMRHIDLLLKDLTAWEDFDDNEPVKSSIGFNPIGFNKGEEVVAE